MDDVNLHEWFHYEPDTGELYWKKDRKANKAGAEAGYLHKSVGYVRVHLFRKEYLVHRLGWFLHHGVWPKEQLDHINHIRHDNRLENLREATHRQNNQHKAIFNKGVTFRKGAKFDSWVAQTSVSGKKIGLGSYRTREEAEKAYEDFILNLEGTKHFEPHPLDNSRPPFYARTNKR